MGKEMVCGVCGWGCIFNKNIRVRNKVKRNLRAMPVKALLVLLVVSFLNASVFAQTIRGEVLDMDSKQPVTDVAIENIYNEFTISTDAKGGFLIAALGGQLLEFKKPGYKTVHVRIPNGYIPPYFRIIMKKGFPEIQNIDLAGGNRYNYKEDSIRYHEIYKHELDVPRMSGIDMVASPFSALSKKNREIWQFQADYDKFEKEKYVDKTFNAELITKFTGLKGDSLRYFMKRYRPTYEQLRAMNDYAFYSFIKTNVRAFRSQNNRVNAQ